MAGVGGREADAQTVLDAVFGEDSGPGSDPSDRARRSTRVFVRNQSHVAHWSEGATGRRLAAFEALEAFGWNVMSRLGEADVALFATPKSSVAALFKTRREAIGLDVEALAVRVGLEPDEIRAAEGGARGIPMRVVSKIAPALAIDGWTVGVVDAETALDPLGTGLRRVGARREGAAIGGEATRTVFDLAEAAWIIGAQMRLERWLSGDGQNLRVLGRVPAIGGSREAAWREGAVLADRLRNVLGLGREEPIADLTDLVEVRLAIPVIRTALDDAIAGAALSIRGSRGIVLGLNGINEEPGPRRITLAHELCHVLCDTDTELAALQVDEDGARGEASNAAGGPLEARAQAFAAQLLAPSTTSARTFEKGGRSVEALGLLMERYGVSATCAKRQILVGTEDEATARAVRALPNPKLRGWRSSEMPDDGPISRGVAPARAGRVLALALQARADGLIDDATVLEVLGIGSDLLAELRQADGLSPPTGVP